MTVKHSIIPTFNLNQQPPQNFLNRHSHKLYYWFFDDEPLLETAKRIGNQTNYKVLSVSGSLFKEPYIAKISAKFSIGDFMESNYIKRCLFDLLLNHIDNIATGSGKLRRFL